MMCPVESCPGTVHPGWAVCRSCAHRLEADLAQVPALQAELDTQTARDTSRGHGVAARASERPLPYDPRAAERTWLLRNTLVGWVRDLEPDVRAQPVDTLPGLSRWLLARLGDLLVHPAADEAVSEIGYAVRLAWRVVDNPPERVFLGACGCGVDLFAPMDARAVRCRDCGAEYDPDDLRDGLTSKLAGHLVTAQEFAGYAVRYLGAPVRAQERLEASVRTWAARGRVRPAGAVSRASGPPQPTYRFGDLAARLAERSA
jgi:hypothetical protein